MPQPDLLVRTPPRPDALLGQWAASYGKALLSYFRRRTAAGSDDQDLVQEVFARLAHRGRLDDVHDAERYIFRIASNVLSDWRRRRRFIPTGIEDIENHADDAALPDRIAIARDLLERLVEVVGTMPARTQAVFSLHHFEHMTHAQIGEKLGIAVRTVEDHLARANAILMEEDFS